MIWKNETERADHFRDRYFRVAHELAHRAAQETDCGRCVGLEAALDCVAAELGEERMAAAGGVHRDAVALLTTRLVVLRIELGEVSKELDDARHAGYTKE